MTFKEFDNKYDGRCPKCNNLAHGKFNNFCNCCGTDKRKYGYEIPAQTPFKNFLIKI